MRMSMGLMDILPRGIETACVCGVEVGGLGVSTCANRQGIFITINTLVGTAG